MDQQTITWTDLANRVAIGKQERQVVMSCCNHLIYKVAAYNLGNAAKMALATSISKPWSVILALPLRKDIIEAAVPRTGLILARRYTSRSTNSLPVKLPLGYIPAARDQASGDSLQPQLKKWDS